MSRKLPQKTRWVAVGLSGLGLLDSLYLTWVKWSHNLAFCGGIGDCEAVNFSIYSEIRGIPIALLGAGAYLTMMFLLMMEGRDGFWSSEGPWITFGISLTGVLYSAYLTYIELAVLHAVCPYCVVSAVILVALLVLNIYRLQVSG
jgi:uncharacterized membrane protein